MRYRGWLLTCLSAALISAPAVHAQTGTPPAAAEPSLPEKLVEDVSGAIRGLFRSIFGEREGEITSTPGRSRDADHMPSSAPATQPAAAQPAAARPADEKGAKPVAAVSATPAAAAAPQSLHAAIAKGDYGVAMKMIEQGADIEGKDPGAGASALHYAVMKGAMPMVGLLLQRGADVNSRTKSGTTPLHTAVLYGHFDVAEYLLEKGAEVNAKSSSGATPLSLALAANFQRIEKMLRGRGAL